MGGTLWGRASPYRLYYFRARAPFILSAQTLQPRYFRNNC